MNPPELRIAESLGPLAVRVALQLQAVGQLPGSGERSNTGCPAPGPGFPLPVHCAEYLQKT